MDVEKYLQLKKSPPTIFANNCMGGLTYHSLGLRFTSPIINMYMGTTDYLKLLKAPKEYMDDPLELERTEYNQMLNIDFPVVRCKDILLFLIITPLLSKRKKNGRVENNGLVGAM